MRSEIAYFLSSTKLPTRISLTYKIPNASPEGMHPHEQYKNAPNKNKRDKSGNANKLPTTLNTTAKDKTQNTPNNDQPKRRKAYQHKQKARAKREASNTIPPLNPEERGMSGPEPPPSEARVSYSNHRPFRLNHRCESKERHA